MHYRVGPYSFHLETCPSKKFWFSSWTASMNAHLWIKLSTFTLKVMGLPSYTHTGYCLLMGTQMESKECTYNYYKTKLANRKSLLLFCTDCTGIKSFTLFIGLHVPLQIKYRLVTCNHSMWSPKYVRYILFTNNNLLFYSKKKLFTYNI